mgnify:CR=1 FL=1
MYEQSEYLKSWVLNLQDRVLLNTIPNLDCDIDQFISRITDKTLNEIHDFDKIDLFAPLEILEC